MSLRAPEVRWDKVCEAADVADILMSNSVHPILD